MYGIIELPIAKQSLCIASMPRRGKQNLLPASVVNLICK